MKNNYFIYLAIVAAWILMGFKPPKSSAPKSDILFSKYGGDVEKMMREERIKDSIAHPYLYQTPQEPTAPAAPAIDDERVILEKAAVAPAFPGGETGLQEYIASSTAFIPDTLVGKKATVIVKFYVNTLGDAKNPKIIQSDNASFDLQSLLVIEGMPKWTPAQQNGKEVNCYVTLPLKYGQ